MVIREDNYFPNHAVVIDRPQPTVISQQHMCMDKGYNYPEVYELLEDYGYTIHIRLRGEDRVDCKRMPRYRARHWIVERTHSWMNRFRTIIDKMGEKSRKLRSDVAYCMYMYYL